MKLQFDHLDEKNLSYFGHATSALNIAGNLFLASVKTAVHAFMPDTFKTAASDCAETILAETKGHNTNDDTSDKDK